MGHSIIFRAVSAALIAVTATLGASIRPAVAEGTVVVELFTSQGCSSCPAADRVLASLAEMPGVVALSLNVDYWDYLGWKDDLARPEFTARQRAYAREMRVRSVYTPQMVFDGKMHVIGSRKAQVQAALNAYLREADTAKLSVQPLSDGRYQLDVAPLADPPSAGVVVWLVGFDRNAKRKIGGGENSGRSLVYTNVVRDWREGARWDGTSPLSFRFERPEGKDGCAVIVQEGEVGPILGASRVDY